jgi:biopolymer transport protein ExbB
MNSFFISRYLPTFLPLLLLLLVANLAMGGQDMRELQVQARQALQSLQQKAVAEEETARQEAARSRDRISGDRATLLQAVQKLETEVGVLDKSVVSLETEEKTLEGQETALIEKATAIDSVVRELVGVIRVNAKDIESYILGNLQTALTDTKTDFLQAIASQGQFPGIADITKMNKAIRQQIPDAGAVRMVRGSIVDRSGNTTEADILVLGNFTAAYRLGDEVGYLNYSPAGRKLFALSHLPSGRQQKQLRRYMEGKDEAVPMDISRGGALSQLTHSLSIWQQITKGGPLAWPILVILALGIIIVIERMIFLFSNRIDADGFTRRIETMAVEQNWQACKEECARLIGKPVARVVAAGLACCQLQREVMENALQEAILKEVPPMERFLSTLGMLAAIAPLLGLLGTVTGMIDTFQVITQHGTGDSRMMSGGISVALVTTMLGLSVAIPIMLAHTLISREVDNRIAQMEEKAMAILNIVHKNRNAID